MHQDERTEAEKAILEKAAEIQDERWVAENEVVLLAQAKLEGELQT